MSEKRWDGDERGHGVASAAPFAPGVNALQSRLHEEDWVAEDPHAHLVPHIARACAVIPDTSLVETRVADDGTLEVLLDWRPTGDSPKLIHRVFDIIGSFAESSTHVLERSTGQSVEFDVVTGMLPGQTHFRSHGHLVRIRVADARASRA